MPIYEFRCNQCDMTFEELCRNQKDREEVVCPECDNSKVERLMSAFSFASSGNKSSTGSSSSSCRTCSSSSCKSCSV